MNMVDKTVYLTMTYDVIDGAMPSGWKDIKAVWFVIVIYLQTSVPKD